MREAPVLASGQLRAGPYGLYEGRSHGSWRAPLPAVLKTAFLTSANVYRSRLKMETCRQPSADVRSRSLRFANLAVVLAVSARVRRPDLSNRAPYQSPG